MASARRGRAASIPRSCWPADDRVLRAHAGASRRTGGHPEVVEEVLAAGAAKVRPILAETMREVRDAVGIGPTLMAGGPPTLLGGMGSRERRWLLIFLILASLYVGILLLARRARRARRLQPDLPGPVPRLAAGLRPVAARAAARRDPAHPASGRGGDHLRHCIGGARLRPVLHGRGDHPAGHQPDRRVPAHIGQDPGDPGRLSAVAAAGPLRDRPRAALPVRPGPGRQPGRRHLRPGAVDRGRHHRHHRLAGPDPGPVALHADGQRTDPGQDRAHGAAPLHRRAQHVRAQRGARLRWLPACADHPGAGAGDPGGGHRHAVRDALPVPGRNALRACHADPVLRPAAGAHPANRGRLDLRSPVVPGDRHHPGGGADGGHQLAAAQAHARCARDAPDPRAGRPARRIAGGRRVGRAVRHPGHRRHQRVRQLPARVGGAERLASGARAARGRGGPHHGPRREGPGGRRDASIHPRPPLAATGRRGGAAPRRRGAHDRPRPATREPEPQPGRRTRCRSPSAVRASSISTPNTLRTSAGVRTASGGPSPTTRP